MQARQFRIGELAKKLCVEKFVIRFWEKEFNIKPQRSLGQQRFYTEKDLKKFTAIKDLLYQRGYTIAGAKKQLNQRLERTEIQTATKTTFTDLCTDPSTFNTNLKNLRTHLVKLRELLLEK
jgi:DNA-binding transcriptional MerR regulator